MAIIHNRKAVEAWWGFLAAAIIIIVVVIFFILLYIQIKGGGESAVSGIMNKLSGMFK